jgi:DNA modification methylase
VGKLIPQSRHRVMCGDSTNATIISALMGGEQVDLIITDPPYNVSYSGGANSSEERTIQNDDMGDQEFRTFLGSAFSAAHDVMRPGAAFYVWHADSEGYNFRGALRDADLEVRQCLIWAKQSLVLGRQDYQWKHEPCLYGWKAGAAHSWYSDRTQTTVMEFNRPTKSELHPTMKPIDLLEYQIGNSSEEGQLVLDLFLGSGSTLIASERLGRRCNGIELEPKYVDVIVKRWQDFTGQLAILERSGKTFNSMDSRR